MLWKVLIFGFSEILTNSWQNLRLQILLYSWIFSCLNMWLVLISCLNLVWALHTVCTENWAFEMTELKHFCSLELDHYISLGIKCSRAFKCILGSEASHMREMDSAHYSLEIPCMFAELKGLVCAGCSRISGKTFNCVHFFFFFTTIPDIQKKLDIVSSTTSIPLQIITQHISLSYGVWLLISRITI